MPTLTKKPARRAIRSTDSLSAARSRAGARGDVHRGREYVGDGSLQAHAAEASRSEVGEPIPDPDRSDASLHVEARQAHARAVRAAGEGVEVVSRLVHAGGARPIARWLLPAS